MKQYLQKHHRILGGIGAGIAFVVASIYLVVVPEEASRLDVIQRNILTYGHSLCWVLLCVASSIWSVKGKNKWSAPLAYMALATYVVFMGTLLLA